jgi:hypothetical protein
MTRLKTLQRQASERGRAQREAADAPAPKPPTAETVAKARSYWGRDEKPVIVNPLSRGPYTEMAKTPRHGYHVGDREKEDAPVAAEAPEPKPEPTDAEIEAAQTRFETYRDATAARRRTELGLPS